MPIDWKSPEAFTRLLAAMVASQDQGTKFDYRRIATMYGQGATYDSIEGRFRIIKREAAVLKDEIQSGAPSAASSFNEPTPKKEKAPRKPRTPKKALLNADEKVMAGRINKTTSPTKIRKAAANVVKGIKEEMGSSESSFFMGDVGVEVGSENPESSLGWNDFDAGFGIGIDSDMQI